MGLRPGDAIFPPAALDTGVLVHVRNDDKALPQRATS
jgi:hypothetical protein